MSEAADLNGDRRAPAAARRAGGKRERKANGYAPKAEELLAAEPANDPNLTKPQQSSIP